MHCFPLLKYCLRLVWSVEMRQRGVTTTAEADATVSRQSDDVAPAQSWRVTAKAGGAAPAFQFATWAVFVAQVWLLDFGRPFFALYLSNGSSLFELSISDYVHLAYTFITPICLIKLQDSSPWPISKTIQHLLLICFALGCGIHMVADAVQHTLLKAGAKFHLSLHQQPMLQNAQPSLLQSFHLLNYLDEHLGHELWYTSLYSLFLLYFSSCFYKHREHGAPSTPHVGFYTLLLLSTLHEWYAVTEAQVFPQFSVMSAAMVLISLWYWRQGAMMDHNGIFLLLRCLLTHFLVVLWVGVLWRDAALREKYEGGWLYIPEPWSFVSLHLMNNSIS